MLSFIIAQMQFFLVGCKNDAKTETVFQCDELILLCSLAIICIGHIEAGTNRCDWGPVHDYVDSPFIGSIWTKHLDVKGMFIMSPISTVNAKEITFGRQHINDKNFRRWDSWNTTLSRVLVNSENKRSTLRIRIKISHFFKKKTVCSQFGLSFSLCSIPLANRPKNSKDVKIIFEKKKKYYSPYYLAKWNRLFCHTLRTINKQ